MPKTSPVQERVFISHAWSCDALSASEALVHSLTNSGIDTWYDMDNMAKAEAEVVDGVLPDVLSRAIRECSVFIACVDSQFSKSRCCKKEMLMAATLDKPILYICVAEYDIPPEIDWLKFQAGSMYRFLLSDSAPAHQLDVIVGAVQSMLECD
ncbi:MAG: toll/interleukin-1 receptor domain-containing protein [Gammaproteobacteria bacterium]|nr:toll/interleukin-1 receptor domain-containing protein [Gammaproteobacteria bacterium]